MGSFFLSSLSLTSSSFPSRWTVVAVFVSFLSFSLSLKKKRTKKICVNNVRSKMRRVFSRVIMRRIAAGGRLRSERELSNAPFPSARAFPGDAL